LHLLSNGEKTNLTGASRGNPLESSSCPLHMYSLFSTLFVAFIVEW
jgi:hypothetical protein